MPNHASLWLRASTLAVCLLLVPWARSLAQDGLPDFRPFRWIDGEGSITVAGGDVYLRPSFDADFRLAPQSDGIHPGDDFHMVTSVAFPAPPPQANPQGPPIHQLVVRLSVDGDCFQPRGRALIFRAAGDGAITTCVEAAAQIFDGDGGEFWDGDFDRGDIRALTVELIRVGRRGRWKLRSIAAFADPGFPLPVVSFDTEMVNLSGVTIVVGDDGLFSPFLAAGFRTLAP